MPIFGDQTAWYTWKPRTTLLIFAWKVFRSATAMIRKRHCKLSVTNLSIIFKNVIIAPVGIGFFFFFFFFCYYCSKSFIGCESDWQICNTQCSINRILPARRRKHTLHHVSHVGDHTCEIFHLLGSINNPYSFDMIYILNTIILKIRSGLIKLTK